MTSLGKNVGSFFWISSTFCFKEFLISAATSVPESSTLLDILIQTCQCLNTTVDKYLKFMFSPGSTKSSSYTFSSACMSTGYTGPCRQRQHRQGNRHFLCSILSSSSVKGNIVKLQSTSITSPFLVQSYLFKLSQRDFDFEHLK